MEKVKRIAKYTTNILAIISALVAGINAVEGITIPYAIQMIIGKLTEFDCSFIYFIALFFVAIAFVSKFKLAKPGAKKMTFMITMGVIEVASLIVAAII